jgi:hypothetical protein
VDRGSWIGERRRREERADGSVEMFVGSGTCSCLSWVVVGSLREWISCFGTDLRFGYVAACV